ncbi:sugar phosphate isomerase/epimerase family protein [Alsobacter sp. SYSU BS001988]
MPSHAIGLAPLGFLDLSPPDFVRTAGAAGFGSVGIRTRAAVPGGVEHPMDRNPALMRETREAIAATGVRVVGVEQVSLFRDTVIDTVRPMLEAGAAIGATRVLCSGDDEDLAVVADRFAELCEAAAAFGLTVDLEFMPFRALKTLEQARQTILRSGAHNAAIAVDALHLMRSGGGPAALAAIEPRLIGCVQLCDAPAVPPAAADLAAEARERRLPPGEGGLPLRAILDAVGPDRPIDAEVPLGRSMPDADPLQRATLVYQATARVLAAARPGQGA